MTLECSNDVNVSLRKQHQEVLDTNKRKLSLSLQNQNTGMEKTADFHLQLYSSSPAPKRDYHGLTISGSEIILNSWDISRGTHVFPRRKRMALEDFLTDKWLRSEIEFLFGDHVIMYIDRIAKKDRSIYCVSEKIVRKIIHYLAVNDVLNLKQSSKIFFELCNTNEIWKILFRKIQKRPPTAGELKQAELGLTWCHLLKTRLNDIHERKTIFQQYKKGVETLHKHNHEIGDRIRNTVKKHSSDKWRRPGPDKTNEKLLSNQIKIPTYKSSEMSSRSTSAKSATSSVSRSSTLNANANAKANANANANANAKAEDKRKQSSVKKNNVKPVTNTTATTSQSQSLLKKRIESKKNIETTNEIKKVTFNQTAKTVNANAANVKTAKNAELKLKTKTTKITKNNENLKSKTFIA